MSDLCMYELEEIVLDEFDQTDDHIVPHPGNENAIEPAFQGDSCKKAQHEVIGISSYAGDCCSANYVSQVKGEGGSQPLKNTRGTMLEKDSWSHTPEVVFPASHDSDSNKEATSLASDNTRMSSNCLKSSNIDTISTEFCAEDPIIGESSETENDFSFFHNDSEDKESNDLLYYGWPDIGNFEDVDKMFRSCESTFGFGGTGNEDEFCWFSSSHSIEGPEEFKFCCPESSPFTNITEQHEPSKLNNASSSVNDSSMESASSSYKSSFWASEGGEIDAVGHLNFMNGSDTISESMDKFTPKEQGIEFDGANHFNIATVNQSENENSGMQQAKHHYRSENGGSFHHTGNLWFKDTKLPFGDSSRQIFTSPDVQKQKKNVGPDSFGNLQAHIPYVHLDYIHPSDQILVSSTPSGIKSKSNGLTSLTPKESSYASNQVQPMESSHDCSFEAPVIAVDDKKENPKRQQGYHPPYTSSRKHMDLVVCTCDPISVPKQVHHSQNEVENHSEIKGVSIRIPADLYSSNVQENSCVSSGLGEISLEASSFHQLQQVMEQVTLY